MTTSEFCDFLDSNIIFSEGDRIIRGWIYCRDGFKFSVQASDLHKCYPRSPNGPWQFVEVGYPNDVPVVIDMKYTTEAWVPVEDVISEIEAHGGIYYGAYTMDMG